MASLEINNEIKESIEEKRKRCLLGELPDDFLRIPVQSHNANYSYPVVQPQYIKTKQLEVTIVQARLAKNYGLTRMDPYCKVRIGHKTYETVTAFNGSKNPHWNKKFMCVIPKGVDAIHVSIFDEKTMSSDEEIAFGLITLPDEIFEGQVVDKWFPLSGKQGENQEGQINVVLSMKEVQVLQTPMYQQYQIPGGIIPTNYMMNYPNSNVHQGTRSSAQSPPQIKDSDVDQLHEMFPSIENTVIRTVLEENAGNKETTITALLSISDDTNK